VTISNENALLETARYYHSLGLNVIPIAYGSKRPIIKWEPWQTKRVTLQQVEEWFGNPDQPVNIAIICGSVSGNFVGLDFDTVENYQRFWGDTAKIERETIVVDTARGVHVWCRSFHETPKFKVPNLIDVQGEGGYILAPPSLHPSGASYRFRNPAIREIVQFDSVESEVWARAKKLGIEHDDVSFLGDQEDPHCVRTAVRGVKEPGRNEIGVRLAAYWLYWRHETRDTTWDLLRAWNKRNLPEPLSDFEIRNIMKSAVRGGKVAEYGCNAWRQMGAAYCNPEIAARCPINNKLVVTKYETKQVASAVVRDGRLVEEGYDGEHVYFIVYDPKTGKTAREERVLDLEAKIDYEPLNNQDVENFQVLLPTEAVEYGTDETLFDEIAAFLNRWHEQPDENERVLDVLYAFETNLRDLLPQICYRRALGAWGKAKSTFVEVLGSVCYRPFFTAGCSSEAALRRTFHLWRGTALVDEADFDRRSDLYATMMRILNIGFDSRFGWYKCCDEQDASKVLSFYVFGPKILANRKRFADLALESRCQTFIAQENRSPMPLFRLRQFAEGALRLRNKLLMWRFRNYARLKDRVEATLENPSAYDELYGKDSAVSSRIKQVTFPLSLIMSERLRDKIRAFAEEHDALLKSLDEDRAIAQQVEAALAELVGQVAEVGVDGSPLEVPLKDIAAVIMGPPPNRDDKDAKKDYDNETKALCKRIATCLRQTTLRLKEGGHGGRVRVQIPWGLPSTPTKATSPTIQLGKDGDYVAELVFPVKIALKERKLAGLQSLDFGGKESGPVQKR